MRVGYADPPYPGQSKRLYGEHEAYAGEVNHAELVARLTVEFDAWVLHTSASALHEVLPLCPAPEPSRKNKGRYLQGTGTRMLCWVKNQTVWRPVSVQYGWEPILIYGARTRPRGRGFLRDWIECNPQDGNTFTGSKPRAVCEYIFEAMGLEPSDELVDLFPGSGAVMTAWERWRAQGTLLTDETAYEGFCDVMRSIDPETFAMTNPLSEEPIKEDGR